jgi:pyridoxal phosphate enzyme (YggS family)
MTDPLRQQPDPQSNAQATALRLSAVRERIERACAASARPPGAVELLAVSKTFGHDRVLGLAAAGQRAFGENYLQEALDKIEACQREAPHLSLIWHFIGPVQSNKTRSIAESFDWVHSVDRDKIGRRLSEQRPAELPPLSLCLQVNLSGEASKSGCEPHEAIGLAMKLAELERVRLRGLMTLPAPGQEALARDRPFERLRMLFDQIREKLAIELPGRVQDFDTLSMGMSDDLEQAIAAGATIVRVGTALFGRRDTDQSIRPSP